MRPNVLQLVASFDQGGSERQAIQLARLLHESGRCRVRLACLSARGVLRAEAESIGAGEIEEFQLTSFHDANFVRQLRRFARFLRANEIDVVQTHDFYTNVFGTLGAALARVPARIAAKRETVGMRTRAQSLFELQVFRLAHRVVANSEAVARKLLEDGVRASKIVTVYNGLDAARVSVPADAEEHELLDEMGIPRGLRLVTIVANLRHEVKDIPTFLRAAARVRARVPDAAFVVAGEGPLEERLRGLAARLGISGAVFFVGRCTYVAELLHVSDVCVLSSVAEGFSNSILEYMAAARPVVATDVGGAREAVVEGQTGYLITPGDDEALAARVAALLEEPSRARAFGEAGRARVASKFSCEARLEKTLELYRAVLACEEAAAASHSAAAVEDVRRGGL